MMALPVPRRIVTANREDGRSYIAEDGPSASHLTVPGRPGYAIYNLWRMTGLISEVDSALEQTGIHPPIGGNVIRIVDFPPSPKDPEARRKQFAATFGGPFKDARLDGAGSRAAGMHITQTVDYAVMLQGEIVALMDEGEVIMKAGDVLIQRGTYHAWENRSNEMARIVFVLIDAKP